LDGSGRGRLASGDTVRLIAPFGFYGWGNIGDESTLQGFARLVERHRPTFRAWMGCRNVGHCRKAEPSFRYFPAAASRSLRRHWAWRTADAAVVAGGTPIGDALGIWPLSELIPLVERAHSLGKPIGFVGTGTERLRRPESRRAFVDRLAPKVTFWTVRSERDQARLIEFGAPSGSVAVAADMAWGLDPVSREFGERYLGKLGVDLGSMVIGVNVNIEEFVREEQPRLLAILAAFLDETVERYDASILFMCNEVRDGATFDLAASRELAAQMRRGDRTRLVPNKYWTPQAMLSMIGCCQFTVSTRYHFCLFSALQGVPFLAVQRSEKVSDLCADIEWPYGVPPSDLQPSLLKEWFEEMVRRRPDLATRLDAARRDMRLRSERNVAALDAIEAAAAQAGR
jgi:polysaccharide pyruvyl transferase WcaK-like protein